MQRFCGQKAAACFRRCGRETRKTGSFNSSESDELKRGLPVFRKEFYSLNFSEDQELNDPAFAVFALTDKCMPVIKFFCNCGCYAFCL
jgi:hypothetical protein